MSWSTKEINADTRLITDAERLVGSVARVDDKWMVEIIWNGPTGDITYLGSSIVGALSFIEGVEKAFAAMAAVGTGVSGLREITDEEWFAIIAAVENLRSPDKSEERTIEAAWRIASKLETLGKRIIQAKKTN